MDEAIPGWAEGMQKINKGGKIKLYIPPQLAYGDVGSCQADLPHLNLKLMLRRVRLAAGPPARRPARRGRA